MKADNKERYTLTLDKEVVDKIEEKISKFGGKLSTYVNKLLKNNLD